MSETELAAEREILARERATRPIAVRPDFVRVTGSFDGAVFLSQLLYWFGDDAKGNQRARVQRDGYAWVAKSADEWAVEVGALTLDGKPRPSMIRRVSKELSQGGLIVTKVWKFAGVPTVHYRPEWTRLRDLLTVAWENGFEAGRQIPDLRQVDKSNSRLSTNPTKEAETTTETTSTPVGEGATDAPSGDASPTADLPPDDCPPAPTPAARRDQRHALGLQIAEDVGKKPEAAVYKRGTRKGQLNAEFGGMAGDICKAAGGSYDAAFLVWDAFRDAIPADQWERFGSIGAVETRFARWIANGGGPKVAEIVGLVTGAGA